MGKVTMQDIADSLNISRVTVWKVFNNQKGVSQSLREQVLTRAQEMGYAFDLTTSATNDSVTKNIALVVSRPDSSTFWTSIIHSMAKELSFNNVNLLYTYVPSEYTPGYTLPNTLNASNIDGCVIINIYDARIYRMLNSLAMPKVFLDITPDFDSNELSGDLFLIEGFRSEYEITKSLVKKGYKNIGFLGDIEYARTNLDRYKGFMQCIEDNGLEVSDKYIHIGKIGINSYYEELAAYLDSLSTLPDAFVCVSDYIIHFLLNYFNAHQDRLKKPLILTGFDGSDEYEGIDNRFSTAFVDTNMLGKRLAMQLLYRLSHDRAPLETIYIKPRLIYRKSILQPFQAL